MMNTTNISSRNDLIQQLPTLFPNGKGAEIGVYKGHFSKYIIDTWKPSEFCCVDSWCHFDGVYQDASNVSNNEHQIAKQECENALQSFIKSKRCVIMHMTSKDASGLIEDDSMDFVYIDARHDYRSVMEDLTLWYPKVKNGGIFAGHDYFYRNSRRNLVEVLHAVNEFFYNKHDIYSTSDDNLPSWYMTK